MQLHRLPGLRFGSSCSFLVCYWQYLEVDLSRRPQNQRHIKIRQMNLKQLILQRLPSTRASLARKAFCLMQWWEATGEPRNRIRTFKDEAVAKLLSRMPGSTELLGLASRQGQPLQFQALGSTSVLPYHSLCFSSANSTEHHDQVG